MQLSRLSDRWIAFLIWLALLVAILETSSRASSVGFGNGWISYFPLSPNGTPSYGISASQIVAVLFPLGFLIFFIARAWLKFSTFTIQMLIALSKYETDDSNLSLLSRFLTLAPINSTNSSSYLSDILRPLGYVWILTIIMPYVNVIGAIAR